MKLFSGVINIGLGVLIGAFACLSFHIYLVDNIDNYLFSYVNI